MIETLRLISEEKYKIDEQLKEENERLEFYKEFFKNNKCTTLDDALNCDLCELAIAIIINQGPHLSVEKVKKIVRGNKCIFGNINVDSADNLILVINDFYQQQDLYKKVKKIILNNEIKNITNHFSKAGQAAIELNKLIDKMETHPQDFFDYLDAHMEEHKSYGKALAVVSALKEIKDNKETAYQMFDNFSEQNGRRVKNKTREKIINDSLNYSYNIPEILKSLIAVKEEYIKLDCEQKQKHKELSRNKTTYEMLESNLYKAIQAGEVKNVNSLIKKVPSEKIRLEVLKLIYKHNKNLYDNMTEEYQQLAANDASHYRVLLAKYGISPELYEVETVMGNSIEELEKMLNLLGKLNFSTPQELLIIIQNSDLETISNIQGLAEKGIITANLLRNHPTIFSSTSKEYEVFMKNLKLLKDKNLNPHYLSTTEELFILPTTQLTTSFETLEAYGLIDRIKNGMNLKFLKDQNLPSTIDTLLELGYERNLEDSLELLNYKDKFNRLKILKTLNIPIGDTNDLKDVLTTDKFYVPDEDIERYIYNGAEVKLPTNIIQLATPKKKMTDNSKLAVYSNTERTYSFDGVLISKNKVRRNLSTIESIGRQQDRLLYGVLKGSTLTDEEVSKIVTCISSKKTTIPEKKKQ